MFINEIKPVLANPLLFRRGGKEGYVIWGLLLILLNISDRLNLAISMRI
jgi:hypothetical protein